MIKVENVGVYNISRAIYSARNPMNSWNRSDSYQSDFTDDGKNGFVIGKNDLALMRRLYKAGTEHRKYLRQIFVSMDITAPLYFWKQFDQYRSSTTTNSCSTMHTIHKKEFELDDFSHEHLDGGSHKVFEFILHRLNECRKNYLETKDKKWWWQMIQLLPSSYNQKRTWTGNYENLVNMYHQRKNHKLDEWHQMCKVIEGLPYMKEIMEIDDGQD